MIAITNSGGRRDGGHGAATTHNITTKTIS